MKRLLAAVFAAALALGLCAPAFAWAGPLGLVPPDDGAIRPQAGPFTIEGVLTGYADGSVLDMEEYCLYTQGSGDMILRFQLGSKEKLEAHVDTGKVSASVKREMNDIYKLAIHPEYGAEDIEPTSWQVVLDAGDTKTYIIQGKGAYSDVQGVHPGDRLTASGSALGASDGQSGFIFDFDGLLDEAAYIRCAPGVELWFDGDYGTDRENLRVETGIIEEVADFFGETDIDCYDFIGAPRFADKLTVRIEAGRGSTLYQYNRKTGDLTRMSAGYDAGAWSFSTRRPGTYIIAREDAWDN